MQLYIASTMSKNHVLKKKKQQIRFSVRVTFFKYTHRWNGDGIFNTKLHLLFIANIAYV